ncbi:uncharacterized protein [Fopius arisanus]|uniref:Uncharacterized protein isoform X2 n=1 Tax=Fopius arisanus TaxID=64838 RepID=A0A9R1TEZ2_9HYME|nr:PREDICTED: uncharacterized protein LOC105269402 isoform X2 [Fopius arisanus]
MAVSWSNEDIHWNRFVCALSTSPYWILFVWKSYFEYPKWDDTMKSLKAVHPAQNDTKRIEAGAFSGLNMNALYLLDNKVDRVIETDFGHELLAAASRVSEDNPQIKMF